MCHVFKKRLYENQPYCTSNVLQFHERVLLPILFEFVKDICTFFLLLCFIPRHVLVMILCLSVIAKVLGGENCCSNPIIQYSVILRANS